MSFNVILFTDTPNPDNFTRGYGAYRIASEIRQLGYTVLTVDFCSAISIPMFMDIINKSIGEDTLLVGFSSTWFPYRQRDVKNDRFIIGQKSLLTDPRIDFDAEKQEWYHESISYKISQDGLPTLVAEIKKLNPKTKVIMGGGKANEYVTESCLDNVFIGKGVKLFF